MTSPEAMPRKKSLDSERDPNREDEIGFWDLWQIILLQKKLVGLIWVGTVLCAVGYLLLATPTPVYQSKALIKIGKISEGGTIEDLSSVALGLEAECQNHTARIETSKLDNSGRDSSNIITAIVQDKTKSDAESCLRQSIDRMLNKHKVLYDSAIAIQQQFMESLKQQLVANEKQVKTLNALIEAIKDKAPSDAVPLIIEKGEFLRNMQMLQKTITDLRLSSIEPNSRQTKLLGEIMTGEISGKANANLILILSVVLGLMLGIFCALVKERLVVKRDK